MMQFRGVEANAVEQGDMFTFRELKDRAARKHYVLRLNGSRPASLMIPVFGQGIYHIGTFNLEPKKGWNISKNSAANDMQRPYEAVSISNCHIQFTNKLVIPTSDGNGSMACQLAGHVVSLKYHPPPPFRYHGHYVVELSAIVTPAMVRKHVCMNVQWKCTCTQTL
jgi:hypothetical protein